MTLLLGALLLGVVKADDEEEYLCIKPDGDEVEIKNGTCLFTTEENAGAEKIELEDQHLVGVIVGFTALGLFWLFTFVNIIIDEIRRHSKYNKNLVDDHAEMERLGMDIAAIDAEYKKLRSGKAKVDEEEEEDAAGKAS